MQEADRHGLDPRRTQAGGERAALLLVDRSDDVAVRGNALVQLEAEMPFDERRWLAPEEVVHVRDPQPAELEHVAEAGSRDEGGAAASPLEDGVRRNRRPMHDLRDRPGGQTADCLDDGEVVARGRREQLADLDARHPPRAGSRR